VLCCIFTLGIMIDFGNLGVTLNTVYKLCNPTRQHIPLKGGGGCVVNLFTLYISRESHSLGGQRFLANCVEFSQWCLQWLTVVRFVQLMMLHYGSRK
jgi:hypothetical protein